MTLREAIERLSSSGIDEARELCRITFREIGGFRDFELRAIAPSFYLPSIGCLAASR